MACSRVVFALVVLCLPAYAGAVEDFRFALLQYDGHWNLRQSGMSRLAWEIRRRTSIEVDLEVTAVRASSAALFQYPFLVWQGDQGFDVFPEDDTHNLRRFLQKGGTLLVDLSDGAPDGAFARSVKRQLAYVLPDAAWEQVPSNHVLYKSFYLLDRHGGRVAARSFLEGLFVHGRLSVVLSANDMFGALSRDAFGEWEHEVPGGEAGREMSFRLGLNLVMYALCLDYKDDQVHLPHILRRRR